MQAVAENKKRIIDIETENIKDRNRLILHLMWPALCENLLSTLVSMADTVMVSSLGTSAINAVGLCTQPRFIVFSAFMALGTGTTALVARAKGAGNREEARRCLPGRHALSLARCAARRTVCAAQRAIAGYAKICECRWRLYGKKARRDSSYAYAD